MTKIFIDPGHGGRDPGAVANGLQEKALVLDIALRMRNMLLNEYEGVQVRMSRDKDVFVSLEERARMANSWGADYFVSVHINAGGGTGFESFVHTSQASRTVALRNVVHDEIIRALSGVRDRGKKVANFAVLRLTRMPAILTENLFVDHVQDASRLKDPNFLSRIARGHAEGIAKAFGLRKKQQQQQSSTSQSTSTATSGNVMYRVVTGSFRDRENAERRVAELKKAGFESFIDVYRP
ncbi:cell wall hydrolase/autolysin [Caldalkalibacillus thermarum TA2.A1]|uniref:Cell wall hydrolase/autolysin n=1 Tax=Caldalkalibacillus thermarum (strain TA2.A1) TaxID=986075 RepID=F5L4K0_CALTT|nr:N-acetylmuramoyl-L-alanine amidase [Caldalkalibacillus thermarum]EGL83746.1 cell wall hydrolase/autolysin [Caldalkalibacillus thermarum TA2.A1]QZT33976.1 N-acetylmuramoyl-L-alanine amidase [Caldalkalibacillus thermarum TA2.A1]